MTEHETATATADVDAVSELDFLTFVEFAVAKATAELAEIDPLAMRLVLALHRVTSSLVYDLEATVHRPSGWSWAGFRVLFVLWLAGPSESKTVASLSGMSRSAVSALVKTLERDGLVTRTPSPADRRAVEIELTDAGHDAIVQTYTRHNRLEQEWTNTLSEPEQLVLIGLLEKIALGNAARASIKRR
ncbi:MarR family winged helix-turn-helix transcriptional regulator [Rhodococcus erythropolis]|uniref:MarR family winged helix-turn-helix transcriptional regulator n=1 Tax=Rhodococcus erythropolis TaxID=1833 RepID=UPI0008783287|nr:MarR family transcriptional regulator [Rhodococcus erythropolis]